MLNTRYFSHYNREKDNEPTDKETAIEYIRDHLKSLRGEMNEITLS